MNTISTARKSSSESDFSQPRQDPAPRTPKRSVENELFTPETDYFETHLRNAVPFDRQTEREITTRIEALSRARAVVILGFPEVFSAVMNRVHHHCNSQNESGTILRSSRTLELLLPAAATLKTDLRDLDRGDLTAEAVIERLNDLGEFLISNTALISTRIVGNTAIERYRALIPRDRLTLSATISPPPPYRAIEEQRRAHLESIESELTPLIDSVVQANLRLVRFVASKFPVHGELREELVAAGNFALIRCARDFKASYDVRFSTYAFKSLKHAMIETLAQRGKHRTLSLHQPLSPEGDGLERIAFIADPTCVEPFEVVAAHDHTTRSRAIVTHALDGLPNDERAVIERHFGLGKYPAQSFRTIGAELGLSSEQVRVRLERGKLRLNRLISSMAEWQALVPEEPPTPPAAPPLLPDTRNADRVSDRSAGGIAASARIPPAPQADHALQRLLPSDELFSIAEDYARELNRIRRSTTTAPLNAESSSPCLEHMRQLHGNVIAMWPLGSSEKRYGFQLEGEMFMLRKILANEHIAALHTAMQNFRTALANLPKGE